MVDAKALRSRRGSLLLQTADAAHAECQWQALAAQKRYQGRPKDWAVWLGPFHSRRVHKARSQIAGRTRRRETHLAPCYRGSSCGAALRGHGSFVCTAERVVKESRQAGLCMDPLGRIPRHTHVNDIVRQEPWQSQPCCQDKICVSFYFLAYGSRARSLSFTSARSSSCCKLLPPCFRLIPAFSHAVHKPCRSEDKPSNKAPACAAARSPKTHDPRCSNSAHIGRRGFQQHREGNLHALLHQRAGTARAHALTRARSRRRSHALLRPTRSVPD